MDWEEKIEFERLVAKTAMKSAQLAAQKALELAGLTAPFLTLRGAYKTYGSRRVKRWIENGMVKPVREGGNAAARVPVTQLIEAAIGEDSVLFYNKTK